MNYLYKIAIILSITLYPIIIKAEEAKVNIEQLKSDIKIGNVSSMRVLGDYYAQHDQIDMAEKLYKQGLYKEDGRSALALVALNEEGKIILRNSKKIKKLGIYYLKRDASNGGVSASLFLGQAYSKALFVEKNYEQSNYWLVKAYDLGNPTASFLLGISYIDGLYNNVDSYRAFKYFKEASDGGIAEATRQVAISYMTGIGAMQNSKKAETYYKKAANQGDILAMRDYALFVKKYNNDSKLYIYWLNKAYKAGDLDSAYYLGKFYKNINPKKSKKYFEFAKNRKHYLSSLKLKK